MINRYNIRLFKLLSISLVVSLVVPLVISILSGGAGAVDMESSSFTVHSVPLVGSDSLHMNVITDYSVGDDIPIFEEIGITGLPDIVTVEQKNGEVEISADHASVTVFDVPSANIMVSVSEACSVRFFMPVDIGMIVKDSSVVIGNAKFSGVLIGTGNVTTSTDYRSVIFDCDGPAVVSFRYAPYFDTFQERVSQGPVDTEIYIEDDGGNVLEHDITYTGAAMEALSVSSKAVELAGSEITGYTALVHIDKAIMDAGKDEMRVSINDQILGKEEGNVSISSDESYINAYFDIPEGLATGSDLIKIEVTTEVLTSDNYITLFSAVAFVGIATLILYKRP